MHPSLRLLAVSAFAITCLISCNTMKKKCEKTDWNAHGKQVAMGGKWLNEDPFVKQCEKAEAKIDYGALDIGYKSGRSNYCKPEVVYKTGKEGKFLNGTLCDDGSLEKLKMKHAEGVAEFCQPANAFRVAAQGWVNNNICPKKLEKAFLVEYFKGRKVYLQGLIDEKSTQVSTLDQELREIRSRKYSIEKRLTAFPSLPAKPKTLEEQRKEDPKTQSLRRELDGLQRDNRSASRSITKIIDKKKKLNSEIAALKREMNSIR